MNRTREKVSKKYKLKQSCVVTALLLRCYCVVTALLLRSYCVLTAFLLRPVRSYHVLTARPPRPLRAYGVSSEIWARQRRSRAIPRRSHHDYGVLTTRLLRVSRVHDDLRAFLPRSHGDYILSRSNFSEISRGSLYSYNSWCSISKFWISSAMMMNTKYSDENDVVVVRTP